MGLPGPRSTVMAPAPWTVATLKEYACGGPYVGLAQSAEQNPQHRIGVWSLFPGWSVGCRRCALIDDDRRGQAFEQVHVRAIERRHEALDEGAVVSLINRCDSAAMVLKTRELLPEPEPR